MDKCYEKIQLYAGCSVEDAVKELFTYKERGILACLDFNGTILYSDTVTIDEAYKQITGKTKAEFDKTQQDWKKEYEKKEKEHIAKIPELTKKWMQKGREILTENKWYDWDKIIPIRLHDLYHGMELGCCLDIVKILNSNGTFDEAKLKIESQNHSGMSYSLVCAMIREFCDRGKEFVKYLK